MKCPVNYISVVQGYNLFKHKGIDFGWYSPEHHNQPVYSCDDGEVLRVEVQKSGGNVIFIRHYNGLCSCYGHLQDASIRVKKGDKVFKGQHIANMGATGKVTGEHLHFQLYKGDSVKYTSGINPLKYINIYDEQEVNEKSKGKINHTKHATANLNIRNATNTKGKIVDVAKKSEQVETYGLKNKWNIVDNARGYYCSNNYLK